MAKVIALLNPKGGVGKSTLTSNLARAFQLLGKKVLIVDSDPQGTLRDWREADNEDIQASVVGVDRPTLHKDIPKLSDSFDFIFIDGAAKLQEMIVSAVKVSDIIIIPVQPSAADVWGCRDLVDIIKARQEVSHGSPKTYFMINRQIKKSIIAHDIEEILKEYGMPILSSRTSQRVVYAEAMSSGTTVLDAFYEGEASLEIQKISQEIMELCNV